MKTMKQVCAAALLVTAMGTAGAADDSESSIQMCFYPAPVSSVGDVITVTLDAVACVASQLISAE